MMAAFVNELDCLLDEVKTKLHSINPDVNNSAVLFIFDSMRNKDLCRLPFLEEKLNDGAVVFDNAFSAGTHTTEFICNLFYGDSLRNPLLHKKSMDNKRIKFVDIHESKLIEELHKRGYSFFCTTGGIFSDDSFGKKEDYIVTIEDYYINHNFHHQTHKIYYSVCECMWYLICFMLERKNTPFFAYLHFMETHLPLTCGYHSQKILDMNSDLKHAALVDDNKERSEWLEEIKTATVRQFQETLEYTDIQLKYFSEFLPFHLKTIYSGYHGHDYSKDGVYSSIVMPVEDNIHVPLIICDGVQVGHTSLRQKIRGMYSHIDILKLLFMLLDGETNYDSLVKNDYVAICRDRLKSARLMEVYGYPEKVFSPLLCLRGYDDKYIQYSNGDEEYYFIEDEKPGNEMNKINLINDPRFKERIDFFRRESQKYSFEEVD